MAAQKLRLQEGPLQAMRRKLKTARLPHPLRRLSDSHFAECCALLNQIVRIVPNYKPA